MSVILREEFVVRIDSSLRGAWWDRTNDDAQVLTTSRVPSSQEEDTTVEVVALLGIAELSEERAVETARGPLGWRP